MSGHNCPPTDQVNVTGHWLTVDVSTLVTRFTAISKCAPCRRKDIEYLLRTVYKPEHLVSGHPTGIFGQWLKSREIEKWRQRIKLGKSWRDKCKGRLFTACWRPEITTVTRCLTCDTEVWTGPRGFRVCDEGREKPACNVLREQNASLWKHRYSSLNISNTKSRREARSSRSVLTDV